jgi:hypothetical protein
MRCGDVWTVLFVGLVVSPLGGSVGCVPETGCLLSGGAVDTATCCGAVDDFPNTCTIGACSCAPEDSHEVNVCACGPGRCFNGLFCTPGW